MTLGPIFIFDTGGIDLDVQPDIASAEGCVEVRDIDELTFIAVDGTILRARAEGYKVRLEPTDSKNSVELRSRLRAYLSHPSVGMDRALADDPAQAADAVVALSGRLARRRWARRSASREPRHSPVTNAARMPEPGALHEDERVQSTLTELEEALRVRLGNKATVERRRIARSMYTEIRVNPSRAAACPVGWLEAPPHEVIVFAGRAGGGRWELDWSASAVQKVEEIVNAVVRGCVSELVGRRRSRLTITWPDGSTESAGVAEGWFTALSFGWRARARTITYESY